MAPWSAGDLLRGSAKLESDQAIRNRSEATAYGIGRLSFVWAVASLLFRITWSFLISSFDFARASKAGHRADYFS